jgi:3-oxoacyl-[acyl-carrier protein] reductase
VSALWIITGASRGIGRAIAEALASPGRSLLLTATRATNLEPVLHALAKHGIPLASCALDLTRPEALDSLEQAIAGREVAGLVNNAGVLEQGELAALTDAQIDRALAVNVSGLMKVTRLALRTMKPGARILNVGSISGTLGTPGASLYNATKWAVTGLTKSWAEELRPRGIFVGEVRPGSVETDMLRQTRFPAQMQPGDVATLIRFLAHEAPMAMTGSAVDCFG